MEKLNKHNKEMANKLNKQMEDTADEIYEEEEKCLQEWLKEYKVVILRPEGVDDLEYDMTEGQFLNLLRKCNIRVKYNSPLKEMWDLG